MYASSTWVAEELKVLGQAAHSTDDAAHHANVDGDFLFVVGDFLERCRSEYFYSAKLIHSMHPVQHTKIVDMADSLNIMYFISQKLCEFIVFFREIYARGEGQLSCIRVISQPIRSIDIQWSVHGSGDFPECTWCWVSFQ